MTTEELNTIVQAVVDKINEQVVDFDVVSSTPENTDLLSAVRPKGDGTYQGVTLKWDDVANAVTREAKGYRDEAASAKTNVENMKASVDQTVSDFNTLAEEKKQEVQGVYQTDFNDLKGDLSNSYIRFPFDYDGVIEDGIILIRNGTSIYNQGKHGTYDVSNIVGKTVFITGHSNNAGDDQKAYVLYGFYDTNGTLLSHHKSVSNTYYNDIEVSVPLNATTLIVNGLDSGSGQPNVKLDTIVKPSMPIIWKLNNDCLTVITKYKYSPDFLSDLAIYEFGKRGVNNLPDFRFITLAGLQIFENSTDWHAPYIIGAINDIDGDDISNHTFTGGNHGYNNTGSMYTTPTARNIKLKYYADGKELSNGSSGVASNISISWVNRVQGYNTRKSDGSGREILEERHTLTFNGKEWESTVEIMPLEDIRIETYYGFQCVVTQLPNIYMIGANYRQPFVITDPHSSGNNTPNKYVAYNNMHRLEMEIDRSYDLGTGIFYGDSGTDGFRTISSGKGYAYLISSRAVSANAIYGARAFYRFMPND